jgi:hypothetical protein
LRGTTERYGLGGQVRSQTGADAGQAYRNGVSPRQRLERISGVRNGHPNCGQTGDEPNPSAPALAVIAAGRDNGQERSSRQHSGEKAGN